MNGLTWGGGDDADCPALPNCVCVCVYIYIYIYGLKGRQTELKYCIYIYIYI